MFSGEKMCSACSRLALLFQSIHPRFETRGFDQFHMTHEQSHELSRFVERNLTAGGGSQQRRGGRTRVRSGHDLGNIKFDSALAVAWPEPVEQRAQQWESPSSAFCTA